MLRNMNEAWWWTTLKASPKTNLGATPITLPSIWAPLRPKQDPRGPSSTLQHLQSIYGKAGLSLLTCTTWNGFATHTSESFRGVSEFNALIYDVDFDVKPYSLM